MPKLIVPVGLPGSGKSTLAATYKDAVVISSDALRAELFGDAAAQYDEALLRGRAAEQGIDLDSLSQAARTHALNRLGHALIFEEMGARTRAALAGGKDVVYDATNLQRAGRTKLLADCRGLCDSAEAVFFDVPLRTALKRNARRERTVPVPVVRAMHRTLERPRLSEGFSKIRTVRR